MPLQTCCCRPADVSEVSNEGVGICCVVEKSRSERAADDE